MLRHLLLAVSLLACVAGAGASLAGHRDATPLAFWGGLVAVAVLLERWRYRARHRARGGDWQPTDERFIDPETGQALQVFYDPRTGERRYEPLAAAPDHPHSPDSPRG